MNIYRIGCIFDKKMATDEAKFMVHYKRMYFLFSWLFPKKFKKGQESFDFMEQGGYGKDMAFKDVPDATKIYNRVIKISELEGALNLAKSSTKRSTKKIPQKEPYFW